MPISVPKAVAILIVLFAIFMPNAVIMKRLLINTERRGIYPDVVQALKVAVVVVNERFFNVDWQMLLIHFQVI
jgi:hypothetical protein